LGTIAQGQHHITFYQRNDGLPANLTKTTVQDRHGFIWIGTDLGLVRFDGKRFRTLSEGLPSPYVKSFFTTRDSLLVAITDQGMVSLHSEPDSIGLSPYKPLEGDSLPLAYPKEGMIACNGDFWIAQDRELLRIDRNGVRKYGFDTYGVNFLRSLMLWEQGCGEVMVALPSASFAMYSPQDESFVPMAMRFDPKVGIAKLPYEGRIPFHGLSHLRDGRVAVATGVGLMVFRMDAVARTATLEQWELRGIACSYALEAPNGQIYACTFNEGLFHAPSLTHLHELEAVKGMPFHVVNYAYADRDENIWINGDGGLALLQPQFFTPIPVPSSLRAFSYIIDAQVRAFMIDGHLNIHRLEGEDGTWEWAKIASKAPLPGDSPLFPPQSRYALQGSNYYVADSTPGTVWEVGPQGRKALLLPGMPAGGHVRRDRDGNLWVNHGDTVWMRRPNGQVRTFTHPRSQGYLLAVMANTGEAFMTGVNNPDHYLYRYDPEGDSLIDLSVPIPPGTVNLQDDLSFLIMCLVREGPNSYWIGTSGGLFRLVNGVFNQVDIGKEYNHQPVKGILPDQQGGLWLGMNVGLLYYRNGEVHEFSESDGLPTSNINMEGLGIASDGRLWVATPAGVVHSLSSALRIRQTASPIFTSVSLNGAKASLRGKITAPYHSYVEVHFTAPTYPSEKVQYRYRINHREDLAWSAPMLEGQVLLPQLSEGDYLLEVQAKQQGTYDWSPPARLHFYIEAIWYRTWWGLLAVAMSMAGIIFLSIRIYGARLRDQHALLEAQVAARTQEIQSQHQEIAAQRDHLHRLHEDLKGAFSELQQQKTDNEAKTKNITDSLNYASRIQVATLPSAERMREVLPSHFVFFRPRDIVSGDFYWCNAIDEHRSILAVADCTGHGVPGAFMSMIGSVLLDQIVFMKGITSPAQILHELNKSVQKALNQSNNATRDGMDISICLLDKAQQELTFAGAKGQLVYVEDRKAHRVKGDSTSIGGEYAPLDTQYSEQTLSTANMQSVYLFSDGYQDQFGGPDGKKFMSANFRKMMVAIQEMPVEEQRSHLVFTLEYWMNPGMGTIYPQLDDILVIGLKFRQ
jgi:serine phosphatase RsbU (regulator of sigma subunit)/ligand-binding sensor domain-containing protein